MEKNILALRVYFNDLASISNADIILFPNTLLQKFVNLAAIEPEKLNSYIFMGC